MAIGDGGTNATNVLQQSPAYQILNGQAGAISDPSILKAIQAYTSGGMSLQDAMKRAMSAGTGTSDAAAKAWADDQIKGSGGMGGADENSALYKGAEQTFIDQYKKEHPGQGDGSYNQSIANQFFTNPLSGSMIASSQVQSDPILSSMFGAGGTQARMSDEEKNLASRGFSLQPEDNEAYGQASDNIARMFGQQGNNTMQALASRGLASGPNGAAGVAFSGLQGNQNEQLAQAQMQIAQNRMQMNQQRLQAVRGQLLQANQIGQSAINSQFNRNMAGVDNYQNSLKDSLTAAQGGQQQANTQFEQQQATKGPSIGDLATGALTSGLGAGSGALGTSLGGGLGMSMGGINPNKTKG